MAEVMDMPVESSLERRRERPPEKREKSPEDLPPPPPPRRRDRDSRERRDERDDRRYHDRNRSPGPIGSSRDRERDYKRRFSPSPPPYRDRGRHASPRRLSPPPPLKRSRRDDGGYDRRGSPRYYDYDGGYDRGSMGGRPGYPDERSHGRYMNRPPGHQDWSDSGRAGSADIPNMGSTQREGLMSYKQFIQELEDDILPAEAERRYEEYRSEYISTQKRSFFASHKDEEWLKDKYHPTNLVTVIERRNEHARNVAKEFLLDLQNGIIDLGPGVTASSAIQSGQASDPNSEDEADNGGKRRRHGRGPAKENDLVSAAPRAPPISAIPRRIQADIEQAQVLVRKLDKEKGIEENVLCGADRDNGSIIIIRGVTTVKGLEGVELLDTLITYLWRIHGVDYYGMREMSEAKGLRHMRPEGKSYDETNTTGVDWEKKLDSFWQGRLHDQDPMEKMTAKEKIDAAAFEALDPYVRKIRDEKYGWKYGCGAKGCTKLFHAAEFVHKHLRLKHPELVLELTSKVREDLYFQNYMNDADAPGSTPVMQVPIQKDKSQRRRPGMDNRLRDDRGNRRVHDRVDNISNDERYDRTESSPSHDHQPNTTILEGGNPDDPMYDTYGGKGMRGAPPYPSDIPPPPVLMPVPGAGPLGPFVPAPPEVAMRMLRDQGGPSPYEENGGSHVRKGRSAPQVGGPAPIFSVSPAFRQDPRRLRSYQDLDAPEDEVTVIDYRSL